MKKTLALTSLLSVVVAGSANAAITDGDISAINDSINMVQSDGNYTTSTGNYNVATTDYSTSAGFGLYTYDHDNNPDTPEIALTTNNGTETLDNTVFTYTDNNGAATNLGANSTGFTTSDFTNAAGTIDVADGATDLTTLEANTTSVGLSNYQYMANFDNSGDALTVLTADAPELASFHNDVTLTTGAITVNGNDETNKPSIGQYGFTVDLHDGSTGNFDLVYNELTHLYSYNYNGDVELDATDIAKADAQVTTQSNNLIADTTLFNDAVATNTTNYNSAVGHYNTVHGVYESDTNTQNTLNNGYDNYATSFATAQANQTAAAQSLSDAQGAYAADLAIYTPVATAYNNYENSLGKSIDAKDAATLADAQTYADAGDATTLADAQTYADSLASNYDAAGSAGIAEQNAKDYADAGDATTLADAQTYADSLASNYDAAGSAGVAEQNAKDYADAGDATTLASAQTYTNTAVSDEAARVDAIMGTVHGLVTDANATTTSNGKAYRGNLAVGTTVEDHLLALDESIGDRRTLSGNHVSATGSVVDNLQSLNNAIDAGDAATLASAQTYADTGDALTLNAAKAYADNASAFNLQAAKSYTDERIKKLDKDLSAGVASAVALSSVAVSNVNKGEVSVGAGYGYFNGQSAMAFGAAMGLSDRWSINTGAGLSGSDFSIRAGTNYKFKLF